MGKANGVNDAAAAVAATATGIEDAPDAAGCAKLIQSLFPAVSAGDAERFIEIGQTRLIGEGEIVISPDHAPDGLTVLLTGEVRIEQDGQTIRSFAPGSYFGEGSLIRDAAPAVTLTATTPSWVLVFPRKRWRAFLEARPAFGLAMMKSLLAESMRRLGDTNVLYANNKALADQLRVTLEQLEREVKDRIRSEDRARYLASHDPLTGLANRMILSERMAHAIAHASRKGSAFALLLTDLDGFKDVNDTQGHPVGDTVLQVIAERLRSCLRGSDTIARLGGDEFAILQDLSEAETRERQFNGLGVLCDRILRAIEEPIDHDGAHLNLGASIGVAVYPNDGETAEDLMRNADLAMYRAKRDGKGQYRFFTAEIGDEVHRSSVLKAELRKALEVEQLEVHYQPKIDLRNSQIVGMEALLRWRRKDGDPVSPAEFIPLAEQSGLILPIGRWALREACRQTQAWRVDGLSMLKLAVNLSPMQFRHDDVVALVTGALGESGLPADALEIEITEGVMMNDEAEVIQALTTLRGAGVSIAVDDFGTGYSSMSYLKKLRATTVKIDKAFVEDSHTDVEDMTICQAIIGLAHSLGMSVVAEGVSDPAQIHMLRRFRCDQVQGYLVAKPLSAADFRAFVDARLVREVRAVAPEVTSDLTSPAAP